MNKIKFNLLIFVIYLILINQINTQCNTLCASCNNFDNDPNDCNSCFTGYFLKYPTGPTSCETTCLDGYFEKGFPDNKCESCDATCKTCYGADSDNCLTCDTTYLNTNDECVDPCSTGYVGISGVCQKCNTGCETCQTTQANCLTCNFGYFHYNVDNTCLTVCPDGYYPDNKVCYQCDATCSKCDWSTSNDCTACTGTLYLYNQQCISVCPDGTYTETASNTCVTCDPSCETCSGSLDTNCLTCETPNDGYYFYDAEDRCLTQAQCESLSPDHVIDLDDVDGINVYCIALVCDATCLTCDQNKYYNCLSCANPRYLLDTQCVTTCLSYQYGDPATNLCEDCASECSTCQFTDDYCQTCSSGYFFLNTEFACYDECPIGYFENDATMTCDLCDTNCMECDVLSTTCTFCFEGTYLYESTCIPACPILEYYTDEVDNACYLCNVSCPLNYCTGPNYADCQTVCPDGYFEQTSSRTCEPCYGGCTLCQGAATVCQECQPNFLLQGSDCIDDCPVSFYFDSVNVICSACNANCYQCDGPNNDDCISCTGTRFLSGTQCVNTCPGTGVTGDLNDNTCKNCDSSCTTCNNYPNQCTACSAGYYLTGTLCQLCLNGYYGSGDSCFKCHTNCKTCYGPNSNNCWSCDSAKTLYLQGNTCQGNCNSGYFLNTATGICQQCDVGCETCVNSSSYCNACTGVYILYNHKCTWNYCPTGYVIDYTNRICEQCSSSCLTCTGTTASDCSSCVFQQRYYYYGQCLTDCPVGYYKNTYSSICIRCQTECSTCADDDGSHCYTCTSGLLQGTTCVTSCSDGYFKVPGIDVCNACLSIVPSNIKNYCTTSLCSGMVPSEDGNSCEEICGDGKRITDTIECDDGNNDNGDGCSSDCKIEYLWECSGGDASNPDICIDKTEIGFTIDTTNTTYYNYAENAIFQMNIEFNKTFTLPIGVDIKDLIYIEIEGHAKNFEFNIYSLNRRILETSSEINQFLYDNQIEEYDDHFLRKLQAVQSTQYLLEMELTETIRNREIAVTFYPKESFQSLDGSVSLAADSKQVGIIERYMYYSEFERKITELYKYLQPAIAILLIITLINMMRYDETHDNKFFYCHIALDALQLIYFYRFVDLRWDLEGFRFFEQMVHVTDFFIPNIFQGLEYTLSNKKVFEFYFITSSFLENCGGPLIMFFSFLVILAFVLISQIQKFYKDPESNSFYSFLYQQRNIRLQFGLFVDYFLITAITFFTYSILQFYQANDTSILSVVISICMFLLYLSVLIYSSYFLVKNQAHLYDKEEVISEQIRLRKKEYHLLQKKQRESVIKKEVGDIIEDPLNEKTSMNEIEDQKYYASVYEMQSVKRAQEDIAFYEKLLRDFNETYEEKITSREVISKLESRNVNIDVQLTDATFRLRNYWTGIKPNDLLKSRAKSKKGAKINEKIMFYQLIIIIRKFLAPFIIILFNSSAYTQIILLQLIHISIIVGWWYNSFNIFLRKRDNIRAFLSEFLAFLGVCGFYMMVSDDSEDEGKRTRISLFCIFAFMLIFLLHFSFIVGEEINNIYLFLKNQKDQRRKVYLQKQQQENELQELLDKLKQNKEIIAQEKLSYDKQVQQDLELKTAAKNELTTNQDRINELFYTQPQTQPQPQPQANPKARTQDKKLTQQEITSNNNFYTYTDLQGKLQKKSKFSLENNDDENDNINNNSNNNKNSKNKVDHFRSTHSSSLSLSIPESDFQYQQSGQRLLGENNSNIYNNNISNNNSQKLNTVGQNKSTYVGYQPRQKKNNKSYLNSQQSKFNLQSNNEDEELELLQSGGPINSYVGRQGQQGQTVNTYNQLPFNTQINLNSQQQQGNNNGFNQINNQSVFQLQKNPNLQMQNTLNGKSALQAGNVQFPEGNLGQNGPNNHGFLVTGQQLAVQNQIAQQVSIFPQQFNNQTQFQSNQNGKNQAQDNIQNQNQQQNQKTGGQHRMQNKLTLRQLGKQSMAQMQKEFGNLPLENSKQ